MEQTLKNVKEKMEKAVEALNGSLATINTGRATPLLLEKVQVEYYGSLMPVNQVASISVSEGRQLVVKPFDSSTLKDIEKAISQADLGFNVQNDGEVLRINIPALTQERRLEFAKMASKFGEDAKVAIRNIRRDGNDAFKKNKEFAKDLVKQGQDRVQKLTDEFVKKIDEVVDKKAKEITTI